MKRTFTAALIAVTAAGVGAGIDAGARVAAAGTAGAPAVAALAAAQSAACADLMSLSLPNTEITGAEGVAAGAFTPPGGGGRGAEMYAALPAFAASSRR